MTRLLVFVLCIVDEENSAMGYIYEGMELANRHIRQQYGSVEAKYAPIWDIIDQL